MVGQARTGDVQVREEAGSTARDKWVLAEGSLFI